MSSQEASFNSTNSAASLEAEEEEFYITGTEFLDKIQPYIKKPECTEMELLYLDDGGTLEPLASDSDEMPATWRKLHAEHRYAG